MTPDQHAKFCRLVKALRPTEFHHGDCVGADAEASDAIRQLMPECKHFVHPSNLGKWRAFKEADFVYTQRGPLLRNQDIVELSDFMIACPKGYKEQKQGSGTWFTIRYARKAGKRTNIIFPDGYTTQATERYLS